MLVRPMQTYQLDTRRNHLVRVTVERGMNQDIARGCEYAPHVTRFLEAARQDDRGIGAQMPMTRQGELGR